ncbi:glycosyltransferase family 2 protein [Agrobacterium vitis]|uniref:glycosyltransferase family 2 protein n=1 Tax=Agrobacterium vitis TaxID=373 RepID=UPI001572948E|nr:glycosyltransferase family 2 protein [Agrobacterium vitis]NSZ19122.1 glycosyltransferase family 2 protein [Agrobacterium vitis]QZO03714.1 glycosyltransferase [Agrobacterium vitis]UJL88839.1 glycosyltransferase family 2 protein [Agrobacterium vitis]
MIAWTPDVTVVIAAYNTGETIERAIESALSQVNVTVEVVVVDDCSSDDTRERVAALTDPRVRLIALERNKGPGGARNAAIDAARGRWIAVLDSDDTFKPMRLFRMIERAEDEKAQVVVDNLDVIDMNGTCRTMFLEDALAYIGQIDLARFIGSNILFQSEHNFGYMKPIFLRSFLNDKGLRFDESLRIGEDYLLLASALAENAVCTIEPTAGYLYYIREGSISRVLRLHHVDAMMAADAGFISRYPLKGAALAAQTARTRSLKEARAFINLIDSLKARSLSGVIKTALANPLALRHLKMPISVRLRRLIKSLQRDRTSKAATSSADPPING